MLRERDLSTIPADIAALGEQVLREADPYRVIGEQLADIVSDVRVPVVGRGEEKDNFTD